MDDVDLELGELRHHLLVIRDRRLELRARAAIDVDVQRDDSYPIGKHADEIFRAAGTVVWLDQADSLSPATHQLHRSRSSALATALDDFIRQQALSVNGLSYNQRRRGLTCSVSFIVLQTPPGGRNA